MPYDGTAGAKIANGGGRRNEPMRRIMHGEALLDDDLQENNSIPKINDLPLSAIVTSGESALENAVRKVIEEVDAERVHFAAHGSSPYVPE